MAETTITVQEGTLQRFRTLKEKLNEEQDAPDHNSNAFLQALLDAWEEVDNGYDSDPSADAIAEQLKDEISMANDSVVDVDTDRIINRIDDLESQLPSRIAEELQR